MASVSAWAAFTPTQEELAYAQLIFNATDPQKLGIITGDAAVPVFAGSSLPPEKLMEVWAIADHENNGYLTKKGAAAAVRLIAWAQVGEPVTESLLSKCACFRVSERSVVSVH
jgi:epidermal growth factor receptor substrate 15